MRIEEFSAGQRLHVRRTLQGQLAYFPPPVPRNLELSAALVSALSAADRALGELSGVGKRLRNPHMLIRPFLSREAVLSSRIEGTQSSLSDLVLFEADGESRSDVREVANYVHALESGLSRLASLPVSLRLVLSLHRILLSGVRGEHKRPGEFRQLQNWIGPEGTPIERAEFVPPPPEALPTALDDWEKYVHEEDDTPPLVRCALLHYQFETIHPFMDGNGRLGRLLMPLFLIEKGCLSQPLLYLSAFFEAKRAAYYAALSRARTTGELDPWIRFFLEAVRTQAVDAADRADELTGLEAEYRRNIERSRSRVTHALIDRIFANMYVTAGSVARDLNVTQASARASISELVRTGILREMTGRSYGRVYVPPRMLEIVDRKTARPPRRRSSIATSGRERRTP